MKAKTQNLFDIERNRQVIFLETIKELHHRIKLNESTPYNLIRKGALLRLLVVDGSKLYNDLNRKFKLKITLKIGGIRNLNHSLSSISSQKTNYESFSYIYSENGDEIDIPKFLKLPILKINNPHLKEFITKTHIAEEYNINELIKLIANAHGGVHFEKWGKEIPSVISTDAYSPFNINSNSKLHETIDNISNIILKFLEPLCKIIFTDIKKTKPVSYESTTIVTMVSKNNSI